MNISTLRLLVYAEHLYDQSFLFMQIKNLVNTFWDFVQIIQGGINCLILEKENIIHEAT